MCNCGAQSIDYAARSDRPEENLKQAELVPVIPKYGGTGCHVRYLGCEGPLTLARLMHDRDGMALLAFRGEAVQADPAWLEEGCPSWPHLFVRTETGPRELLRALHANHVHAVSGHWIDELRQFAQMTGLRFIEV